MIRTWVRASGLALVLATIAAPAAAQVVHSVSFGVGYFWPRSFDSRVTGDVLVADLTQPIIPALAGNIPPPTGSLAFQISDFRAWPLMGEWHIGFGNHVELGIGASYQNRVVHSTYADLQDGSTVPPSEILQDLRLKVIPVNAVVRLLGGRVGHFQPYAGGGVSILNFKYSETGDFVDTTTLEIYNAQYKTTGTTVGAILLGGIRMPIKGDVYAFNIEGRFLWGNGNTGGLPNFLGDKIDLGGASVNFTYLIRF